MTNDPYASSADFNEHYADAGPPRTSVLAILSLVCSLICFIPGLSAIGSLLGVFALLGISASKGRVKGTGLAIAGIAVGVVVSLIWFGIAIAAQKGASQYISFGQVISDVDAGSYDAARGQLVNAARPLATDERLAAFKAEYEADAGSIQGWPSGFVQVFQDFMSLGKAGQQPDNSRIPYGDPIPLPGRFDNGVRIVWVILDQGGQLDDAGRKPAIINIGVQAQDNSVAWIVDPDELRAARTGTPAATPGDGAVDGQAGDEAGEAGDAGETVEEEVPSDTGG